MLRAQDCWPFRVVLWVRVVCSTAVLLQNAEMKENCDITFYLCCVQASTKWFEGTTDQSIYYAITNDQGLTWSPTRLMVGSPDDLPVWGPVVYTAVSQQPIVCSNIIKSDSHRSLRGKSKGRGIT